MSQMFDTAPDLKPTPFSPRFADQVSEWVDGFGYAAPLSISTPEAEYNAVREAVGALDFSMLYKVDVEGRGALELVDS